MEGHRAGWTGCSKRWARADFQPPEGRAAVEHRAPMSPFLPGPSLERLRRKALRRAGGGFNPSGCWLEAAFRAWPPASTAHRGGKGVERRPCTPAGSMDAEGKDDCRATPSSRQHGTGLFGARTYPQLFRDWPSMAVPCTLPGQHIPSTKRLRCSRRKRPPPDVGGEEGACWVLLLRLCTPPRGYTSRSLPSSLPLQLPVSICPPAHPGAPRASGGS